MSNCNNCGHPNQTCACEYPKNLPRAHTGFCGTGDCDPCQPCESMVKICTYVVPTLEDGRYYRNSFIFNQEDDTAYYISDKGDELPFGSRPRFVDNFNPDEGKNKSQVVYDVARRKIYYFGPDGDYVAADMTGVGTVVTDNVTLRGDGSPNNPLRVVKVDGGRI